MNIKCVAASKNCLFEVGDEYDLEKDDCMFFITIDGRKVFINESCVHDFKYNGVGAAFFKKVENEMKIKTNSNGQQYEFDSAESFAEYKFTLANWGFTDDREHLRELEEVHDKKVAAFGRLLDVLADNGVLSNDEIVHIVGGE